MSAKPRYRRIVPPLLALAAVFGLCFALAKMRVAVNVTGSLPGTIYTLASGPTPKVGEYVQVCPTYLPASIPDMGWSGGCNGKLPLLKRVVAVPGDAVEVSDEGVKINGKLLENSAPRKLDSLGRPLPIAYGKHIVPAGMIWVAGEHPDSYDSRYFGAIEPMVK